MIKHHKLSIIAGWILNPITSLVGSIPTNYIIVKLVALVYIWSIPTISPLNSLNLNVATPNLTPKLPDSPTSLRWARWSTRRCAECRWPPRWLQHPGCYLEIPKLVPKKNRILGVWHALTIKMGISSGISKNGSWLTLINHQMLGYSIFTPRGFSHGSL